MAKPLTAGSEVDAYCTKCKLDLNHRIIALVGDTIKRVECLTCGGHHNYRSPKSAQAAPAQRKARSTAAAAPKRATAGAKSAERQQWEQAIMGKSPDDFTAYKMTELLSPGQLVRHKKFGDGVVAELLESDKVKILFDCGLRTLVHGR